MVNMLITLEDWKAIFIYEGSGTRIKGVAEIGRQPAGIIVGTVLRGKAEGR